MRAQNLIAILLMVAAIYFGKAILSPFFIALFLAILFEPLVGKFSKINISRKVAAGFIVSIVLLISFAISFSVALYANNFVLSLPVYSAKMESFSSQLVTKVEQGELSINFINADAYRDSMKKKEKQGQELSPATSPIKRIFSWIGTLEELFNLAIFVPLLLLYFLIDKENLLESFYALAGKYFYLPKLNLELPKMIRTFFYGNLLTATLLALIQGFIIWYLGYTNYVGLGIISGLLNIIPVFGIPLAFIPLAVEGIIQFPSYVPIVTILLVIVLFHLMANNFLLPILVGGKVNVNSGSLIMGVLFWGWIWGGVGFLLAIPLTTFLKIFLECNRNYLPLANLMSAKPKYILYFGKRTHPYK